MTSGLARGGRGGGWEVNGWGGWEVNGWGGWEVDGGSASPGVSSCMPNKV